MIRFRYSVEKDERGKELGLGDGQALDSPRGMRINTRGSKTLHVEAGRELAECSIDIQLHNVLYQR